MEDITVRHSAMERYYLNCEPSEEGLQIQERKRSKRAMKYKWANILALLLQLAAIIWVALALSLGIQQPVRADGGMVKDGTRIIVDYSSPIFTIIRNPEIYKAARYGQIAIGNAWNPENWVNTQTVAHAPPTINYGAYRIWEQATAEWANSQGANVDSTRGWSWIGSNGYISFFAKTWQAAGSNLFGFISDTNALYRSIQGQMYGTQGNVNN